MSRTSPLLDAVHDAVAERSPLVDAAVGRLTVGDRLVLVELDVGGGGGDGVASDGESDDVDGAAGVAHRPPGDLDADPAGERALDVASWAAGAAGVGAPRTDPDAPLRRAVGVAALNALSAPLIEWSAGDPFEALSADVSTVATVGLFGPAFRKFGDVEVRVVERRPVEPPEPPEGVSVSMFAPEDATAALDGADVAFVTGSTLLYGGTEEYLEAARDVPDVVFVGATASFVPEPAFEAGATMLAGARVSDAAGIRGRIDAGECATDLHDEGLEKVYVTAAGAPEGLDLDTA